MGKCIAAFHWRAGYRVVARPHRVVIMLGVPQVSHSTPVKHIACFLATMYILLLHIARILKWLDHVARLSDEKSPRIHGLLWDVR